MMLYTGLKPLAARCKAQTKPPGCHCAPHYLFVNYLNQHFNPISHEPMNELFCCFNLTKIVLTGSPFPVAENLNWKYHPNHNRPQHLPIVNNSIFF